jgi:hypothetical protein
VLSQLENHQAQRQIWPDKGRHILAHFDEQSVVVYQAYRPAIAEFAVRNQRFGGEFSFTRMSWIKPNFLWMMYRSGWGTKEGQECVLAITITRAAFDAILAEAVHSSFEPEVYGSREAWSRAVAESSVRLQWDPDHDPSGAPLERRAIQLGLRGDFLRRFGTEWITRIEDISGLVAEQRNKLQVTPSDLETPSERVYIPSDPAVRSRLQLS